MIRVGVFGAAGRMGETVCAAAGAADDLELVAAVDPAAPGARAAGSSGVEIAAQRATFVEATVEVAVDFTVVGAARENLRWCAAEGIHAVCGTTGFTEEDRAELAALFGGSTPANCVLAPNFSIGAVVMMRCAELCAPHFEGVEVIELHHDRKRDAPSGTSLETVQRIEAVRLQGGGARVFPADPTEQVVLEGARGGRSEAGVHVHSVRLPGLVAHHEVVFGSMGESLTIRHDSIDRVSFMPGVLLAVRRVAGMPGLTVGLESLLGI